MNECFVVVFQLIILFRRYNLLLSVVVQGTNNADDEDENKDGEIRSLGKKNPDKRFDLNKMKFCCFVH